MQPILKVLSGDFVNQRKWKSLGTQHLKESLTPSTTQVICLILIYMRNCPLCKSAGQGFQVKCEITSRAAILEALIVLIL